MVNSILRDQRRRALVLRFETKQTQQKALMQDASIDSFLKRQLTLEMKRVPRSSSKTRVRRRCTLTGRGRGILRAHKISRILFRELASKGLLNGVQKASW